MRRPVRTVSPVLSAFVLRLRTDALASGEVVGEIENADSGKCRVLRSLDDLLAFFAAGGVVEAAEGDGQDEPTGKAQP